ncbi:hypothetical protein F3J44_29600 [Pantoea sp. Tr-811]|nr:hypothetical protein [Pantoea sp. Tr-811]
MFKSGEAVRPPRFAFNDAPANKASQPCAPLFVGASAARDKPQSGTPDTANSKYFKYMKLKVDAPSNPLIMRPTSSDIGTTNSLKFNELAC